MKRRISQIEPVDRYIVSYETKHYDILQTTWVYASDIADAEFQARNTLVSPVLKWGDIEIVSIRRDGAE